MVDQIAGTRRARHRAAVLDPIVPLVGVLALVIYAIPGLDGHLSRDNALYAYAGQRFAEGVPPYVGVMNRAGPLAHVIPGIGVVAARVGGFDDLVGMRVLFLFLSVLCVCLLYAVGRDLFSSRPAGVVTAAAFLAFQGFTALAANGPREKTAMVLFVVCTMWAITVARWCTAGVFISLATLVLQTAFFVTMPVALVALAIGSADSRSIALARVVLGGLMPLSLVAAYFAVVGALRDFADGFVLIHAEYTVPNPGIEQFAETWDALVGGYGLSLWVVGIGIGALVGLSLVWLRSEETRGESWVAPVSAMAAGSLTSIMWMLVRDFDHWPDTLSLLPLAALGIGALVHHLSSRLEVRASVVTTSLVSAAAVAVALTFSLTKDRGALAEERGEVEKMLSQVPPDPTIVSIAAPQPLVLSGMRSLSRHQMFSAGLQDYVDDTWPGGLHGFREWVKRQQPTLIVIREGMVRRWYPPFRPEYVLAGKGSDWVWLTRDPG